MNPPPTVTKGIAKTIITRTGISPDESSPRYAMALRPREASEAPTSRTFHVQAGRVAAAEGEGMEASSSMPYRTAHRRYSPLRPCQASASPIRRQTLGNSRSPRTTWTDPTTSSTTTRASIAAVLTALTTRRVPIQSIHEDLRCRQTQLRGRPDDRAPAVQIVTAMRMNRIPTAADATPPV